MRIPTGTLVTACVLSAALLVAGCGGEDEETRASGELFLQPAAAQGPDPFTNSTVTSTATPPPPVTRTPQPDRSGSTAVRSVSGGTPGLYTGTARVGSCDVGRQIDHLTRDRARARAFARVEGIDQASVPDYLRGLAPVTLRADTRVTGHGYRDGRTTSYQSVLEAGTAVLVDSRGVPRVRCACGNPLKPPVALPGGPGTSGRPWAGYRPDRVIVVAPAAQVITNVTIIDVVTTTWIERRIGHDVRHDRVVPAPDPVPPSPPPSPSPDESASPSAESSFPEATDCATPTPTATATATPGTSDGVPIGQPTPLPTGAPTDPPASATPDCPAATATATVRPPTSEPGNPLVPTDDTSLPGAGTAIPQEPAVEGPGSHPDSLDPLDSLDSLDSAEEVGPQTVPDAPDLPDGGGLIPDDPAGTDSVFGSPTDVFDS
ncbi:DUF6777 domain-containing protein [Streptomyces sp. AC555_RSS877]|uniref:DUF6777 domain-containing protein n=1 Tax=Streptomyces sp. AC555_RSS877 TaxID=2823688 RepID=UPI001C280CA8|nr:DUF6777 domain-containing protein [Streptomyces sp. AC555_RSS877]